MIHESLTSPPGLPLNFAVHRAGARRCSLRPVTAAFAALENMSTMKRPCHTGVPLDKPSLPASQTTRARAIRAGERDRHRSKSGGVMLLRVVAIVLTTVALMPSSSYADHEQVIVGEMRDVDPAARSIMSVSGTCVPSHDREKLDCYFTTFSLARTSSDETLRKGYEEIQQELKRDPAKRIQDMRKAACTGDMSKPPEPLLQSAARTNALYLSTKAFCTNPSQESLLALFRAMNEVEVKKCRCIAGESRHSFLRRGDRWIENTGPSGLCDVITVSTLAPHDLKKMDTQSGRTRWPTLWTFTQRMVATHRPDNALCTPADAKNPFNAWTAPIEGTLTLKWDAPRKSVDCSEFEFTSVLEGMSHPRKK